MKTVAELLREAADVFEGRDAAYGSTYKVHGEVANALFADRPPVLKSADDHARFGVLTMIIGKLTRYARNFNNGGHADSLVDLTNYAAMLSELDQKADEAKVKADQKLGEAKAKAAEKTARKAVEKPKRAPGRPRKTAEAPAAPKRAPRRKRPPLRSGVLG